GEPVEGRALYERALAVSVRFAPDHPEVARNLRRLGLLDLEAQAWDEARGRVTQAPPIQQTRLGAEHPNVAETLADLGLLALETDDLPAADTQYREALSVWERALGADHPALVRGLNGLTLTAAQQGADARAPLLQAGRLVSRH